MLLFLLAQPFLQKIVRLLTNTYLFVYLFIQVNQKKTDQKNFPNDPTQVFIPTFAAHFYLAVYAALSLYTQYQNLHFIFVVDGELSAKQKKLLSLVPFSWLSTQKLTKEQLRKLKRYKNLSLFQEINASFQKFFIPLHAEAEKIIILDSDTLFLTKPKALIDWIEGTINGSLYLKDYLNFNIISYQEQRLLQPKLRVKHLNSGLLCINLKQFWQANTLKQLDWYLGQAAVMASTRMTRDFFSKAELQVTFSLYEQMLFSLSLNNLGQKARSLPPHYQMLNDSSGIEPCFVHFTPDNRKKNYLYQFLFLSVCAHLKRHWKIGVTYLPSFVSFRKKFLPASLFLANYRRLFDIYLYKPL
jgi:hypothetical protein